MAWQAQISKTERVGEKLNIIVHYQNGEQAFDETIQVVNKPEDGALEQSINNRLTALDALDGFEAELTHPDMQAKTFTVAPKEEVAQPIPTAEVAPVAEAAPEPSATPTEDSQQVA